MSSPRRVLKAPLAEQAQGPFLNPLEQNIPDAKTLCVKVKESPYASLFEQVWEKGSLDCDKNVSATYDRIGKSIAAYERSKEANPFSSKFDFWLRKKVKLSVQEIQGLKLSPRRLLDAAQSLRSRPGAGPLIGARFREHGIENVVIYSSQWCRCLETAKLLDLGKVNRFPGLNSFFRDGSRLGEGPDRQDVPSMSVLW